MTTEGVNIYKTAQEPPTNDDQITITAEAIAHVKKKLAERGEGCGILLSLKQAGCSGMQYIVDFVVTPNPEHYAFPIDDSVTLFVDQKSFPLLKGTTVDYVREGFNARFKFINPNEAGACGCGESFYTEEDNPPQHND